jgi:small-conductance mechanosensitive channel
MPVMLHMKFKTSIPKNPIRYNNFEQQSKTAKQQNNKAKQQNNKVKQQSKTAKQQSKTAKENNKAKQQNNKTAKILHCWLCTGAQPESKSMTKTILKALMEVKKK